MEQSITQTVSTRPNWRQQTGFFLQYHRERIDEYHYFYPLDSSRLCTVTLLAMAEIFDPIRDALAAFASYIYIVNTHDEDELYNLQKYYTSSHAYLESIVNFPRILSEGELEMAISTALVLVTFHVNPSLRFE